MPPTFLKPEIMARDAQGRETVDRAKSERYRLFEALGTPKVFYAEKANTYFKDAECTKTYSDAELTALGMPLPVEIASARKKLMKQAFDAGEATDMDAIISATSPTGINPPPHIAARLVAADPIERMISRVNRSTLGK